MPNIYLLIEGQQEGPYSEEQVRQSLAENQIPSDLPAWHEGLDEWVQVQGLLKTTPKAPSQTALPTSPETKTPTSEPKERPIPLQLMESGKAPASRRSSVIYRYIRWGSAIIVGLVVFGFSVGAGLILAEFAIDKAYRPSVKEDVFRVYQPATEPDGAWYGHLDLPDGTTTDVIIDFGQSVTIADDDIIQGTYIPTDQTGRWNDQSWRIYKVVGSFAFVQPVR